MLEALLTRWHLPRRFGWRRKELATLRTGPEDQLYAENPFDYLPELQTSGLQYVSRSPLALGTFRTTTPARLCAGCVFVEAIPATYYRGGQKRNEATIKEHREIQGRSEAVVLSCTEDRRGRSSSIPRGIALVLLTLVHGPLLRQSHS